MLSGIEGGKPSDMNNRPEIQFCSDLKLINSTDGIMTVEQTLEVDFSVEEMVDDLYRNLINDYIENNVNTRYTGAKDRHFRNIVELNLLNNDIKKNSVKLD